MGGQQKALRGNSGQEWAPRPEPGPEHPASWGASTNKPR